MVRKDSQFKVEIIVFTAILRFVGIELSQVSQLLTIGLYLGSLRICNLSNGRGLVRILVCGIRILVYRVYNLSYRGITVRNLSTRCTLANKVKSKAAWVYRTNLVKWVRYKASNYIKFGTSKGFLSSVILIQEFFLSLFYLVLLIYYIIQGLYNSNSFIPFNLYALVTQEGLQVVDSSRVVYFKDSFRKIREVFLVLLP